MMLTLARTQSPYVATSSYQSIGNPQLVDEMDDTYSNNGDDSSSCKIQDRFETMFESSDRTQAGNSVFQRPSSFHNGPLSKVEEQEETDSRIRYSYSAASTEGSETSAAAAEAVSQNLSRVVLTDASPATTTSIIKLQALVRGYLERLPRGHTPPIRHVRTTKQKWFRRVSDITMQDLGDSYRSFLTGSSNTTDLDGSSEFSSMLYPRSRNQSMDTMTQSIDEEISKVSFSHANNQSTDTFDFCLAREMEHLDISEELAKEEYSEASSFPLHSPSARKYVSDTPVAFSGAPPNMPIRRSSQYVAHDVSSLTENSSSGGSGHKQPPVKKSIKVSPKPSPSKSASNFLKRFCSIPVMPTDKNNKTKRFNFDLPLSKGQDNEDNSKRYSLDVPLGPPKRRTSKQIFRKSSPAALL